MRAMVLGRAHTIPDAETGAVNAKSRCDCVASKANGVPNPPKRVALYHCQFSATRVKSWLGHVLDRVLPIHNRRCVEWICRAIATQVERIVARIEPEIGVGRWERGVG